MGNPVMHFEITGKDGAALRKFYKGLFGWKIDARNPMKYGIVNTDSDGKGIAGGITESRETKMRGVCVYVQVPDLDKTLAKVRKAGGKIVVPPTEIPNMVTFAIFTDPQGNSVGLVKS